jgi:hypothetical protein
MVDFFESFMNPNSSLVTVNRYILTGFNIGRCGDSRSRSNGGPIECCLIPISAPKSPDRMLETLRRIVQEVSAAPDLTSALAITVNRIRDTMRVAACTVYLADEDNREFVLMATAGLNPAAVGQVRLSQQQGLVGWWLNARNR